MEALTRLVTESLARHGFDRPLDYRRLQWSRWFRCESHHSLLFVPSKPGVFALAEEMMDLSTNREGHDFSRADKDQEYAAASAAEGLGRIDVIEGRKLQATESRRMLAVSQFFDADDMAFTLDRMLSRQNPMRARLTSGRYFIRFVVIEDESQRRSICSALNQWITNSTEKATGIGSHFASSLELTPETDPTAAVARTLLSASAPPAHRAMDATHLPQSLSEAKGSELGEETALGSGVEERRFSAGPELVERAASEPTESAALAAVDHCTSPTAPPVTSGAAINIHCPFPSGF